MAVPPLEDYLVPTEPCAGQEAEPTAVRFGPPFILKMRCLMADLPLDQDGLATLTLTHRDPWGKPMVVAVVKLRPLEKGLLEVVEMRPVLDEEQARPTLESFRKKLLQERS